MMQYLASQSLRTDSQLGKSRTATDGLERHDPAEKGVLHWDSHSNGPFQKSD